MPGKFKFFHEKPLKIVKIFLETGLYPSFTDIAGATNTLIQERHKHSRSSITVKMSRATQKTETYLANEKYGLTFFSIDLGHVLSSNLGH